jgi:hypothetical protein
MTTTPTTQTTPGGGTLSIRPRHPSPAARHGIPLSRITSVELRKSFDTTSGLWLLASIGIVSLLTSGAVIAWAPNELS